MKDFTVICYQCRESMTLLDDGFTYAYPVEDERGFRECEYYSQQYQCSNGHRAYTWHVDNEPYGDDFDPVFDGQIDYVDSEGEIVFSENVFEE